MKLSKKSWLIITTGIFAIIMFGLWTVYSQQLDQQSQLNKALTAAELKLNQLQTNPLPDRRGELEQQLAQTLAQSATARTVLARPVASITMTDILLDIAENHGVTITATSTSGLAGGDLAGLPCSVRPISATVTGNATDIVGFILQVNGDLETGIINSVEISLPETGSEEATANIQMAVYTRQGD